MCCSVLQFMAENRALKLPREVSQVYCIVLHCVAVCARQEGLKTSRSCMTDHLLSVAVWWSDLQRVAVCRSDLQCLADCWSDLQCAAV